MKEKKMSGKSEHRNIRTTLTMVDAEDKAGKEIKLRV